MINEIIDEALISNDFTMVAKTDVASFYIRETPSAVRFAILHKLDELPNPSELNQVIKKATPAALLNRPEFKKNCDLICIHRLDKLAEFKSLEEKIFAIEEDPHFFKKYILYHSDTEEVALKGSSFNKLKDTVSDKNLFRAYKENPLDATQYSAAAKIFIKLPFLELPFTRTSFVSLRRQAEEAVAEADLDEVYATIQTLTNDDADELIQGLIENELEDRTN
nr:ABC-three component system middle component 1 [Amylibacter sp.]